MHFLIVHATISIGHGYPQFIGKVLGINAKENDMDSDVVPHLPAQRRLKAHDTAEEVPALTTECILDQVDSTVLVLVDKVSSSPDRSDMLVKDHLYPCRTRCSPSFPGLPASRGNSSAIGCHDKEIRRGLDHTVRSR
ncbi:hypothetical protein KC342_g82 [Hortaea werneckii]|nr:hypothetical protein KC342_g82 [Hortaea werneckii]